MFIKIKQRLWNIFSGGLPKDYDIDVLRKIFSVNLIIIFGVIFLALLGTIAFLQNGTMLGIIDYAFLIFLIWLIIIIRRAKNYDVPVLIGTIATGCFYLYLIASGGVHNTAYIWALTFPLISLFLLGIRLGTLLSLILLLLTGVVFLFGGRVSFLTSYDINIVLRFIPAYLAMLLFAYTSEKIRSTVQDKLWGTNAELLEAVSKLKHANQKRTELFNIATHDLKNPLNSIKSGADLLLRDNLDTDERDEMLDIISKSSDKMLLLISDLLNSEEIESAEFTLKLEEVNLCNVLDEVVDELRIFGRRLLLVACAELVEYRHQNKRDDEPDSDVLDEIVQLHSLVNLPRNTSA